MSSNSVVSPASMGRLFARASFLPSLALNLVLERFTTRAWYTAIDSAVILGALPFRGMTQELVQQAGVRAVVSMNEDYELRYLSNTPQEWGAAGVQFLQLSTTDMFEAPSQEKLRRGVQFILQQCGGSNFTNSNLSNSINTINATAINDSTSNSTNSITATAITNTINDSTSNSTNTINDSTSNSITNSAASGKVYVHCKAGRTRSATLVACYLMQVYGITPSEAVDLMEERRPHVWLRRQQHAAIQRYYDQLLTERGGK